MCGSCSDGICGKCHGIMKIVVGGLVLLNIYVWPKWIGGIDNWLAFFAVLFIIKGAAKLVKPSCGHCECGPEPSKPARKK